MTRSRTLLLLTLSASALAAILWMLSPPHPEQSLLGFHSSAFALQMVRDWPTLTIVLATPARAGFRVHTLVDFAFILAYGALWALMARRYGERAWLNWIVGACVVAGALCDVMENAAILRVLGMERGFSDEMALAIRTWALRKWMLLMLAWFGLSLALGTHRLWPLAVGYAFAAGVTAAAFFTSVSMLELTLPVLGLTLLVQAGYFIRHSGTARA